MPRSVRTLFPCLFALAGCIHNQAAVAPPTKGVASSAVAAPQAAEPAKDQQAEDLAAMLRGDALHFDLDKAELSTESRSRLQGVAAILQGHPRLAVAISGNCDERGTEDYNLQLGQQRADAARRYLEQLGIDGARISTISYGKDKPANEAHTPQGWAENRRDDIQPKP